MIKEHHETLPYHWHLTEKVTLITEKYKEDSSRRSKFPPHFFGKNGGGIQTIVCYVREIPIFVFFGPLFISLRRLFSQCSCYSVLLGANMRQNSHFRSQA